MKRTLSLLSAAVLMISCGPKALIPAEEGAFQTRKYRNVFVEAGYSPVEVDAKVNQVFEEVFFGPDKVYFEVEDSLAYVSDIKNNDVRTEGMSYGMMMCVQSRRWRPSRHSWGNPSKQKVFSALLKWRTAC